MRLLSLDWPHLPLRLERTRRTLAGELVVIGGQPWDPGNVLDASREAVRLGVHRGQPLGSAHDLVPEAYFLPSDEGWYRDAVERAADALGAFTPAVEVESDPRAAAFGRILLGIEGLERLWGDEATLVRRVLAALEPLLPGPPRSGIGNSRSGALVAAAIGARRAAACHVGAVVEAIPRGDAATEAAYLAPLPIRLLPADAALRDRFRLFGLERIGDLARLPRTAVLARFGSVGGDLHDIANGLDARPLRPRRPVERLRAHAELDPPVDSLEPLRFVLHHLTTALCEQLSARGAGAARATLVLELDAAPALRVDQALPEPSSAADLLERLLLARLAAAPPSASITRLVLELDGAAPAAGRQLGLFSPQLARAARLDWQLAGLAIRFGAERILQARIRDPEARLADERFEWAPATAQALSAPLAAETPPGVR